MRTETMTLNETTPPMRTIRRVSLPLNQGKWEALREMARCYRGEKNEHLRHYNQDARFAAADSDRAHRDQLVQAGYVSPHELQARMWKMALKDGYETVARQWAALSKDLQPLIAQHKPWSETAKHYAFWLIYTPRRMAQLVSGRAPRPKKFVPSSAEQRTVRNYLRRVIRRKRGKRSVAKSARSVAFDAEMYTPFEQNGRQYIALMSQKPQKRIIVPLTGNTPITGNLRVVLDFECRRVEIHYTAAVKTHAPLRGEPCGLDAGVSEVFTDEKGHHYGESFGATLAAASDQVLKKSRARGKLWAIVRAAEARGDYAKAARIRQFNLGYQKMDRKRRQARAEVECQINTAINQVLKKRKPSVMVVEQLDLRGKAKSKQLARLVSQWARRALKDRTEFKASAGGSRRDQVNPAYSSQTCPGLTCGFVHKDNRQGDKFQCRYCGHTDDADRVAATNLKARAFDPDIRLWTPKARVKEILLARFYARLERGDSSIVASTVSGRTPGARGESSHRQPESETPTAINFGWENGGAKLG
jgi:putative transposase